MALTVGRKSVPMRERKTESLTIMLTRQHKKALERAAEEAGYNNLSQWAREVRLKTA